MFHAVGTTFRLGQIMRNETLYMVAYPQTTRGSLAQQSGVLRRTRCGGRRVTSVRKRPARNHPPPASPHDSDNNTVRPSIASCKRVSVAQTLGAAGECVWSPQKHLSLNSVSANILWCPSIINLHVLHCALHATERPSRWAHGDGAEACENGGGTCHKQVMSAGTAEVEICQGGLLQNTLCNSARGCDCFSGYLGAHCERAIVTCSRTKAGGIKHWCDSRGSMGCADQNTCNCIDGYEGEHCTDLTGLSAASARSGPKASPGMIISISVLIPFATVTVALLLYMWRREKKGKPLFHPHNEVLLDANTLHPDTITICDVAEHAKPEYQQPSVVQASPAFPSDGPVASRPSSARGRVELQTMPSSAPAIVVKA